MRKPSDPERPKPAAASAKGRIGKAKMDEKKVAAPVPHTGEITLTDVAHRAGVGESTVSRVLRNQGSVSEKTREKILKAASELHYVPNRIAGTLASARSKLVGIIIP